MNDPTSIIATAIRGARYPLAAWADFSEPELDDFRAEAEAVVSALDENLIELRPRLSSGYEWQAVPIDTQQREARE